MLHAQSVRVVIGNGRNQRLALIIATGSRLVATNDVLLTNYSRAGTSVVDEQTKDHVGADPALGSGKMPQSLRVAAQPGQKYQLSRNI